MRSLIAFMKKEWMEQARSGRLMILGLVFVLLGIMNPAVAKLTPWLFEIMADSLAESGMVVTAVEVDAMTSWVQFFKNVPMGLIAFWTVYYWVCYAITYGYNAYFWDNSVASNLMFSVVCWWLFGIWVIALAVLFSAMATANSTVLAGTGAVAVSAYLLGLLPAFKEYSPSLLMDGNSLIYGMAEPETYVAAIVVTVVLSVLCLGLSIPVLDKKRI